MIESKLEGAINDAKRFLVKSHLQFLFTHYRTLIDGEGDKSRFKINKCAMNSNYSIDVMKWSSFKSVFVHIYMDDNNQLYGTLL